MIENSTLMHSRDSTWSLLVVMRGAGGPVPSCSLFSTSSTFISKAGGFTTVCNFECIFVRNTTWWIYNMMASIGVCHENYHFWQIFGNDIWRSSSELRGWISIKLDFWGFQRGCMSQKILFWKNIFFSCRKIFWNFFTFFLQKSENCGGKSKLSSSKIFWLFF